MELIFRYLEFLTQYITIFLIQRYVFLEKGKATQFEPQIAEIMPKLIQEDAEYRMHE